MASPSIAFGWLCGYFELVQHLAEGMGGTSVTQQFPFDAPPGVDPAPQAVAMQAVDPVPCVRIATGHDVRLATRYDDLLTALVEVRDQGDRLTEPELLMTMLSLFGAGQETTASQLSKSVYVLCRHPEQWDRLVADPGLVPQAIEELLRFVALGHAAFPRIASTDTTMSGVAVPAGSVIFPVLNVANRDPAVFPDPDRFDITRADAGLHLSFGRGIHFCLGAPLARLELTTALTALVTMFPTLRLAEPDEEPDWNSQTISRGLSSLPVTW
jgi:cytochrome P450